ncbi:MAG: hypothetical protein KIS66_09030 [Fimbriimonadaceae bacterium]|nr:hypothetical protein [Fimbriimonadaceae bacterium]
MFLLYNLLLTLLAPVWVPIMLVRTNRRKEAPSWAERSGDYAIKPIKGARRVWIHAVSVGEVVAALPILRELRDTMPGYEIVLSVTTSSGHQTARERANGLCDHLVYFPIDVARFQLAALSRVRPQVVAIMETELWPNFLWAARALDARIAIVNGRISDRSDRRSRPFRFFYRWVLGHVDRCLMQTETDAARIRDLGARDVVVLGNCKFDQAAEARDEDPVALRSKFGVGDGDRVIVVGSTRGEEEEAFVLAALAPILKESPRLRVIHAPRHVERADALAVHARESIGETPARRSLGQTGRYLILDTFGELARVYAIADLAIVGGGFSNFGGQNILQPLALGVPVLHGPHMHNFRDVAAAALEAGASLACETPDALRSAVARLIHDEVERTRRGDAARALVAANLGASRRYAEALADLAKAEPPA